MNSRCRLIAVISFVVPFVCNAMKEDVSQSKPSFFASHKCSARLSALSDDQKKKVAFYLKSTLNSSDTTIDAIAPAYVEGLSYAEGKDIFLDALLNDSAPAIERACKVGCKTITSSAYVGSSPLLIAVLLQKREALKALLDKIPATEEELSSYVQHAVSMYDTPSAYLITEFALDKRTLPLSDFIINHGYSVADTGYTFKHSGHLFMHALAQGDFETSTKLFDRYDPRQSMGWFSVEKERGESFALGFVIAGLPDSTIFIEKLFKKGCKPDDIWEYEKHEAQAALNYESFLEHISLPLHSRSSLRNHKIYQPDFLKFLVKNGANPNYEASAKAYVWTPLLTAIAYDKKDAVACLLDLGADINKKVVTALEPYKITQTTSPLGFAIKLGRRGIVELLLKRGGKL